MTRTSLSVATALLLSALNLLASAPKIDEQQELEARQEDDENTEAAARAGKTDSSYLGKVALRGKLVLEDSGDGENAAVLGTFDTGGHVFLVKVAKDSLRGALTKYNGKTVMLDGKMRNENKYFIIEDIPGGAGPPPVEARARRGL